MRAKNTRHLIFFGLLLINIALALYGLGHFDNFLAPPYQRTTYLNEPIATPPQPAAETITNSNNSLVMPSMQIPDITTSSTSPANTRDDTSKQPKQFPISGQNTTEQLKQPKTPRTTQTKSSKTQQTAVSNPAHSKVKATQTSGDLAQRHQPNIKTLWIYPSTIAPD